MRAVGELSRPCMQDTAKEAKPAPAPTQSTAEKSGPEEIYIGALRRGSGCAATYLARHAIPMPPAT